MNCDKCGKWKGAYAGFSKDHDLCVCPKQKEWRGLGVDDFNDFNPYFKAEEAARWAEKKLREKNNG